jgi:hypothetical protein
MDSGSPLRGVRDDKDGHAAAVLHEGRKAR